MKARLPRYLVPATILLLTFACNRKPAPTEVLPVYLTETPYVTIASDTVYTELDGRFWKGILHKDTFHGIYISNESYFGYPVKKFITFDKFGGNLRIQDIAGEIYYFLCRSSFKVVNDSILFVPESSTDAVYSNRQIGRWQTVHNVFVPNYEDDDYIVTSTDNGEFGGMVYFRDKRSGKLYGAVANSVVAINYFMGNYYVTTYLGHMQGWSSIIKIPDPRRLTELDGYIGEYEMWTNDSYSREGTELLYEAFDLELLSSFVHKGRLLHVYTDKSNVHLVALNNEDGILYLSVDNMDAYDLALKNKVLDEVYTFEDIDFVRLIQQKDWKYQQLMFYTKDPHKSGIMEVTPDTIRLHYIVNTHPDKE